MGSLFQVYDSQSGFSYPTSRRRLSLTCVSSQRAVKLQLVKKLPVQGNLFTPCSLASASHLRKGGLGPSWCQACRTHGKGPTHPSSSTSLCFSFWPSALRLDVPVPRQGSQHATFPTSFSISSARPAASSVNPSHPCSSERSEADGQGGGSF